MVRCKPQVASHQQAFLQLLGPFCLCKKISTACGAEPAAQQSRMPLGNVASAMQGARDQSITQAVHMHRFHQTIVVIDLAFEGRA